MKGVKTHTFCFEKDFLYTWKKLSSHPISSTSRPPSVCPSRYRTPHLKVASMLSASSPLNF
jgi:hypothetical protein